MSSNSDPLEDYYFQHENQIICGKEIPPITDEYIENYPSAVDRFFTRYYYIKNITSSDPEPYQVLFHSNRICLIVLAPEHPALNVGIASINFDIGNTDRSKNSVKGKGKKGGMVLQDDSILALITDINGKVYRVPSCVRSKLVEVNTDLINNPKRLETAAEGEGYLAIVLPKPEHCDMIKAKLMTHKEYQQYLSGKTIEGKNQDPSTTNTNDVEEDDIL